MKFCFINTHLASGRDKSDSRLKMASSMLKGIDGLEPDATSDFSFLLGDTNSRFNRKFSEHIKQIKKSPALVPEFDQLSSHLRDGYYPGYQEGEINFMPTYKLDTEICDEYIGDED